MPYLFYPPLKGYVLIHLLYSITSYNTHAHLHSTTFNTKPLYQEMKVTVANEKAFIS